MQSTPVVVAALVVVTAGMPLGVAGSARGSQQPQTITATSAQGVPLASHPQGQQMMADAVKRAALVDVNFTFLDKTYENDVWVSVPGLPKARTSCVRFKATSGFKMRVDVPTFTLDEQGLTIEQNIARISANALKFTFQLGPCVNSSAGFGLSLSNVKFTYKARPSLTFDRGVCKLAYREGSDQLRASIGGLNITGVQNDLDKLAKDAVREGVNFTLDGAYGSLIRNELTKVTVEVCGKGKT